jgi:hypothetical protein
VKFGRRRQTIATLSIGLDMTNMELIRDHDVMNGRRLSKGKEERPKNTYGDGSRRLRDEKRNGSWKGCRHLDTN